MALSYLAALGATSNVKIKINFYQLQDWNQQNEGTNHTFISFVCYKMWLGNYLKTIIIRTLLQGDSPQSDKLYFHVSHDIVLRFKSESSMEDLILSFHLSSGDSLAQVLNRNQWKLNMCRSYVRNPQNFETHFQLLLAVVFHHKNMNLWNNSRQKMMILL